MGEEAMKELKMGPYSDAWSEAYAAEQATLNRAARLLLTVVGRDGRDHDKQVAEAIRYYRECRYRVRTYWSDREPAYDPFDFDDPAGSWPPTPVRDYEASALPRPGRRLGVDVSVENGPCQQI
jgi:hypothetical protein